jgi:hypothetical protein
MTVAVSRSTMLMLSAMGSTTHASRFDNTRTATDAINVRFVTQNAKMFIATFAAVRSSRVAANRQTSRTRSGAYAHSRKLQRLSGK